MAKRVTKTDSGQHVVAKDAKKSRVQVSGGPLKSLKSKYFLPLDFTFENKSDDWIAIENIKLEFEPADAASDLEIVLGERLVDWKAAATQKKAIDDHNRRTFLSMLTIIGTATYSADNAHPALKGLGAGLGIGAGFTLMADSVSTQLEALSAAKLFPRTHLLHLPFNIPPGLFNKKWMLLGLKSREARLLKSVFVTFETSEGVSETFKVELRKSTRRKYP